MTYKRGCDCGSDNTDDSRNGGNHDFFCKDRKGRKNIVLSRAWSNRFSRMDLEDKRLAYLKEYEKYRRDKEKKARKKVREWDRQIEN